jgi:hypothetical protein
MTPVCHCKVIQAMKAIIIPSKCRTLLSLRGRDGSAIEEWSKAQQLVDEHWEAITHLAEILNHCLAEFCIR